MDETYLSWERMRSQNRWSRREYVSPWGAFRGETPVSRLSFFFPFLYGAIKEMVVGPIKPEVWATWRSCDILLLRRSRYERVSRSRIEFGLAPVVRLSVKHHEEGTSVE